MNVFIDLGSHFGAITRKFIASKSYSPDFDMHAFECNPVITEAIFKAYPPFINIHREAAWIIDGEMLFYVNHDQRVQGASIHRNKITGHLDKNNPAKIKCIDFGAWLSGSFSRNDNIIVKSNIEGAEYDLFGQMMNDGTIEYIRRLYLKRHSRKIGMSDTIDAAFVDRLAKVSGLVVSEDYKDFDKISV
jgi:hypothetical protein